jgi:hypothetical protein
MGLLAIVNFLLVVIPLAVAPVPPFDPGADLVAFDTTHHSALILGNYLTVLQLPVGLTFLIFVAAVTRQAEENQRGWLSLLILGSSLCTMTLAAVIAFFFDLSPLIVSLGQSALALLMQLGLHSIPLYDVMQTLMLGAIGVATLRLRFLPAWLGYIAWLAAVLSALATLGLLVPSGPLAASSTVALAMAGLPLPIWILLAGICWLVRPASYAEAARARD